MNNLYISSRDIEVNYPSEWDEIEKRHVGKVGEIMHRCYMGEIDCDIARKMAVDLFINHKNASKKPELSEESLDYWANEGILANSVDFLFKKVKGRNGIENVTIDPKMFSQPLPRVRIGARWYVGPADLMSDLTIYEFKETSWRVGKYAETKDDVYLDEIFAIMYHRGGIVRGRKVRPAGFSDREYCRSVRAAARVPVGIKFMVFLYFIGCMNWVREEAIEIDGVEIYFKCLFQKDTESEGGGDDTGMAGILFQLSESGVFGNMEQTRAVNVWDFFLRLYQIHHQIKAMKSVG